MSAGYSGTPLVRKLGLKDGATALLVGIPEGLVEIRGYPGFAGASGAGGRPMPLMASGGYGGPAYAAPLAPAMVYGGEP